MRIAFLLVCGIMVFPSLLKAAKRNSEQVRFDCTCAGSIACELLECERLSYFGVLCPEEEGQYKAICACQTHLMSYCTNWNEILNDRECARQKQVYENFGGMCSAS